MSKTLFEATVIILGFCLLTFTFCLDTQAGYRRHPEPVSAPVPQINLQSVAQKNSIFQVSAWLPTSWDIDAARESWEQNKDLITEINPIWYKVCIDDQNTITNNTGAEDPDWLRKFREAGVSIVPMISNSANYNCLSQILKDDNERQQHIQDIVSRVETFDYDGIDIDYEKILPEDRDLFSIFIAELASELHRHSKILSIAVHPQKTGLEDWKGPGGQDWARLGALVDEFKIMAYDNHWLSGPAGPIAPLPWVEEILDYAIETVPKNKIQLGVPFYSYDWPVDANGHSLPGAYSRSHTKIATDLCVKYQCLKTWLPSAATSLINYFSAYDNQNHDLYYEDHRSLSHRLDLVREYSLLGGIAIWRLGNEDPQNWQVIDEKLNGNYRKSFDDCQQILTDIQQPISSIQSCHTANKLYEQGLLTGDGQGHFYPSLPLSRAQLLKIVFLAHDIDPQSFSADLNHDFSDVPENEWYTDYVKRARQSGWVQGYADNSFRPHNYVTQSEAIKIFLETGDIDIETNSDNWSLPYWERADELGLTDPEWNSDNNQPFTRGQAALILARYLGLE